MELLVTKRNGEPVDYDENKIVIAIAKAGKATKEFDKTDAVKLANQVSMEIDIRNITVISVETIQDIVEDTLLASRYKKSAKAYVLYRAQHSSMRKIAESAHIDLVDKYLDKLDWQVKENSNMSYSLQGLNNYVASEITKTYWLEKYIQVKLVTHTYMVICIFMILIS